MKIKILALFSIMILVSACGNSITENDSMGIEFKSIDEIINQPLEIANFANDGSATLPIYTSIPVACTLVYGTSEDFGSLTLDQDMAGGTHSDHNPLLVGLNPETEYYYRVQGVDVNGIIYVSEIMTFVTPPMQTETTNNLASPQMGAEIMAYSSAFGGANPEEKWGVQSAFDDNPNTEWSTAGDGNNAWIEVQLAYPANIDSVLFQSRSMSNGTAITMAFNITTETGEKYGPFLVTDTENPYEFEVEIRAQILRFELIDTTGGNTGVVDISVFGEFIE